MNGECNICQEDYDNIKTPISLPCQHTICKNCCLNIYLRDNRCPFCRSLFKLEVKVSKENKDYLSSILIAIIILSIFLFGTSNIMYQ